MNGAALEESIIEQIAKLEMLVLDKISKLEEGLPPKADMTPIVQRLSSLARTVADLEQKIANLPVAKEADLAPVMASLAKLEKTIAAQAQVSAGSSYVFDVKRDGKGKMTKVTASKVMPIKETAKTTLLA